MSRETVPPGPRGVPSSSLDGAGSGEWNPAGAEARASSGLGAETAPAPAAIHHAPPREHPLAARIEAARSAALARLGGRPVVIKYGGAVMDDAALAESWARDVALLASLRIPIVVVHGGGRALTRMLERLGIATAFVDGHRVTDEATAEIAAMVLSGQLNKRVVALLEGAGARAVGISGTDGAFVRIRPHRPGGRDIGFVGEIVSLDPTLLRHLLDGGYLPVVSSTAAGDSAQPYNINADVVAGAVASALGAAELVFLSDVPGVMVNGSLIAASGPARVRTLLEDGTATGGMRPKLQASLAALAAGVGTVRLIDGREPHAALLALLMDGEQGTRIRPDAAFPFTSLDSVAPLPSPSGGRVGDLEADAIASHDPPPSGKPSPATTTEASSVPPRGSLIERGARALVNAYARYPIEIASAAGSRITDTAGRDYLDFVAGIAVNALGHGHPAVLEALRRAAAGPVHTSNLYWTEPMVRLAERLASASGMERAFFCNSGAESIETALKVARKARPGRPRIVVFERSFHGRTLGALSATMQAGYQDPFRPLLPGFTAIPFGDFAAAEGAIDEATAAVLLEPVQGEGGVRPAPAGFLEHLRALCDRSGSLLLLDEVQTGLGRTGTLFAFQASTILPDGFACAKALAGGLPMGAFLARGDAAAALGPGEHGSTFGGGPFVATVALAVLKTIGDEAFLAEIREKGARLGIRLREIAARRERLVSEVRGSGLMWGLALWGPHAPLLVEELHGLGLLTVPAGKDALRLLPPLTVTEAEIDEAAALIDEATARLSLRLALQEAAGYEPTGRAADAGAGAAGRDEPAARGGDGASRRGGRNTGATGSAPGAAGSRRGAARSSRGAADKAPPPPEAGSR
jgi:acetylornithine/N-succinyldiaminopimelate aminotransferase